ncbi:hypothetical protein ACWCY1_22375 [Streptomyces goshikiensis]
MRQISWFPFALAVIGALMGSAFAAQPFATMAGAALSGGLSHLMFAAVGRTDLANFQAQRKVYTEQPWQVWPCRIEAVWGESERRLLLLAPDGTAAAAYKGLVPETGVAEHDRRTRAHLAGRRPPFPRTARHARR